MKINDEKSVFHVTEVEYLGYIIRPKSINMDLKKIQTVKDWPRPTNVKEVQKLKEYINFYRRFVKGYSEIIILLTNFT